MPTHVLKIVILYGKAERKHRQITEDGLPLLAQAKLSLHFLGEAFQTATYLINRLPTPILDHKSPIERLTIVPPDYNFLKEFGCEFFLIFAHIPLLNLVLNLQGVYSWVIAFTIKGTDVLTLLTIKYTLQGMCSLMKAYFPMLR